LDEIQLTVHLGTHQIGGNCIEIGTRTSFGRWTRRGRDGLLPKSLDDRMPAKTEKNGGPWMDGHIQDCDRLPVSIEK